MDVSSYIIFKYERRKQFIDEVLTATGRYYLNEINDDEYNSLVDNARASEASDCKAELLRVAIEAGDELAIWCVKNLATHQALYVMRRLPMYIDEMDTLAQRTQWCKVYEDYRVKAIESGALLPRP